MIVDLERLSRETGVPVDVLRTFAGVSDPANEHMFTAASVTVGVLLASGEFVDDATFCERAGWTLQEREDAVQAGRVFCLEVGAVRAYPAFYLDRRYNRQDLDAVTQLLGDIASGSKWLFFTTPKGSLSARTPLQALEDGDIERVRRAATGYAER